VARAFAALGVVFFGVMFVAIILGVIARYLGVTGFEWSFEIAGLTFVWVTFLGVVVAELRGENVAFEALRDAARPSRLRILELAASLCLLAVGLALLLSGLAMLRQSAVVPTPVLRWPSGLISASVAVCGAAASIIAALRFRRQLRRSPAAS
jgi:TRAP-type C4-dicarboxylate transport system permease small subunit